MTKELAYLLGEEARKRNTVCVCPFNQASIYYEPWMRGYNGESKAWRNNRNTQ